MVVYELSLLFAELINECNLNGKLQVRISKLIEAILGNVTATHGGPRARMKPFERVWVCPSGVLIVFYERSENLDTGFERDGKGYVVEHTEPRRQVRDGALCDGTCTWSVHKLLLFGS